MASDFRERTDCPLGLRNNNPGFLVTNSEALRFPGYRDGNHGFCIFEDVSWGICAFLWYYYRHVQRNPGATIGSYLKMYTADTRKYIATVVASSGLSADDLLPIDPDTIIKVMRGQFEAELGGKEYADLISDADILDGFALLLLLPEDVVS